MTSPAALKTTWTRWKSTSRSFALAVTMLPMLALTGCVTGSSAPVASLEIYQPRVLQLKRGIPVQTKAGLYTPQVDEVWHSAAEFNKVERQLIDTAAALAQIQARR
jgi:hypothetical protein